MVDRTMVLMSDSRLNCGRVSATPVSLPSAEPVSLTSVESVSLPSAESVSLPSAEFGHSEDELRLQRTDETLKSISGSDPEGPPPTDDSRHFHDDVGSRK